MINLEKQHLALVQSILKKYIPNKIVWLFGSRATHNIKPFSDIDLAIIAEKKIDDGIMAQLSLAFSDSDLPYKVDLVDWSMIDDEFKSIIKKNHIIIQDAT